MERLPSTSEGRGSCFFFQAEDGIRDYKVTGVQTCALPISRTAGPTTTRPRSRSTTSPPQLRSAARRASTNASPTEIGRASCRERVEILGDAESVNEKKTEVNAIRQKLDFSVTYA